MTYVYGATLRGTAEFIEEYATKDMHVQWPDELKSFGYSMYAAKKLFQGIAATVPAAAAAMQWLREVARSMPNGKRMEWKTPTGFLVQHDYQAFRETRIDIKACGVYCMKLKEFTEDTLPHAMQNAIAPNFVHALDASHLTLCANAMQDRGLALVAIHDSFGTHACDVPKMHSCIRESFVELYSNRNLMAEFLWDVGGIGSTPARGDLDLNDVLSSEFFFC